MASPIILPKHAVTEFDLPRVCVATGATEDVEYHTVKFSFVPMWARMSVAFCGLVGLVLMLMNTRRLEADIPFTAAAWAHYQRARILPVVILLGGIPLFFVPVAVDPDFAPLGMLGFAAAVVGAVAYGLAVTREAGPVCKNIDDTSITLDIPNAEAAEAIEARLGSGLPREDTEDERDEYDARLEAELDAID